MCAHAFKQLTGYPGLVHLTLCAKRYNLEGDWFDDCCTAIFCGPCAIGQEHRELNIQGLGPGALLGIPSVHTHPNPIDYYIVCCCHEVSPGMNRLGQAGTCVRAVWSSPTCRTVPYRTLPTLPYLQRHWWVRRAALTRPLYPTYLTVPQGPLTVPATALVIGWWGRRPVLTRPPCTNPSVPTYMQVAWRPSPRRRRPSPSRLR